MSKVILTGEPADMPATEHIGAHTAEVVTIHAEWGAGLEDFQEALKQYPAANVGQIYQQYVKAESAHKDASTGKV